MATAHIGIRPDSVIGSTNFKVRYRLMGDTVWASYLIPVPPTSGTTATIHDLLDNRIYDIQIQNINGADNPLSTITQGIGFSEPNVTISPTSNSVGYSFPNLSQDIDSYLVQLTTFEDPATIIASTTIAAGIYPNTLSSTFSGLEQLTSYRLVITPTANQFSEPFVYIFATESLTLCPDVSNLTATFS